MSQPLHMKTRRAVKTASNQDSSGAPSFASSNSRRSSLGDLSRSEDGHSGIEDERPTKRNRLSTDSGTDSFADQVHAAINGINAPESSMSNPRDATDASNVSPKKRRASDGSFESSKSRADGVLTRTQSDTSEQQPRRKKRRTTTQTPAETDQLPELTDASTAPNSPEQVLEVENSQNLHHVLPTNGDAPAKMGRRLPGRRRAPHADINVEVDLRRQLNLKMSYRSLAKLQKNILEELSSRTTTSLDDDPQFHKQCPEYEPLMASLDQYRASRLAQVEALRREKLAQLERVIEAERHIAKEKYIQRVYDLQEDLLLQCFHRAKQLQRESRKSQDGAGTEDEDNILPPARFAFPPLHTDDRVGSKFASRSRAYVESEHLLDDELRRALFGGSLRHFITEDEDADDSILETPTPVGFATFTGPDRAEAIAHQNIKDLIDAANDIENTALGPPAPTVIPNEQADALFVLASLSADAARNTVEGKGLQPARSKASIPADSRQAPSMEIGQTTSPLKQPTGPFAAFLNPMSKKSENVVAQQKPAGMMEYPRPVKEQIAPTKETPSRSTHRVMDMLNNDTDIAPATSRFPPAASVEQTPSDVTSHRISASQGATPSRSGLFGLSSIMHQHDVQPERSTPAAYRESMSTREAYSSPASARAYPEPSSKTPSFIRPMSLEELKRKDPLHMLREMLNFKSKPDGKNVTSQRAETSVFAPRERTQMTAPPLLSQPFTPSGPAEKADNTRETRRASNTYNASPSTAPPSYQQSPNAAPAYLPRRGSQDPGSSHWERDRRLSGSQAQQPPPQPFAASPRQSNTVPPHQSPFSAPSAPGPALPQLPSISQTIPSKPSGGQPSAPINFRFAHYDPAPPRPAYQPPQPPPQPSYPTTSQAPPPAPPPSHYTPSYSGPSHQGGYVPPPGSFQAPPPPPATATNASTPYPPLKIHQYGGQPILPANMAPPPHSQPPSMAFIGQAPPSAYSPPQHHAAPQPNSSYDANAPRQNEPSSERPPEPGSGPVRQSRRPYRSYHAPGSQFRPYNGPDSTRRRGG
ncbi:uncharacterized protein N0V89_009222 [Didymosphaeria variabile]|uniref:Uncharacterized protein n=1 Tax=Didymosphaeria variabile TaxID=1932322 RepID=A0A9W8XDE0_9PLEO|nr:uncharacterized protein N0V89_009222 [Didymosphaeria variabile]KAJ4347852.1 hypothetical protein N0V89_009222 [Didymosphaeria variabile]